MKEKQVTTSNAEKLQILNFVSDSWSRKYGSEYFGVSENLIRSTRELQQRKGYLHNLPRKKVKQWPKKQLILFMLSMRMMNTTDSFPGKRIMQAYRKVFTNKSSQFFQCHLHELFVAFKDYLRYVAYQSLLDPNIAFIYEKDNPYKHFSLVCLYILIFFSGHIC